MDWVITGFTRLVPGHYLNHWWFIISWTLKTNCKISIKEKCIWSRCIWRCRLTNAGLNVWIYTFTSTLTKHINDNFLNSRFVKNELWILGNERLFCSILRLWNQWYMNVSKHSRLGHHTGKYEFDKFVPCVTTAHISISCIHLMTSATNGVVIKFGSIFSWSIFEHRALI